MIRLYKMIYAKIIRKVGVKKTSVIDLFKIVK